MSHLTSAALECASCGAPVTGRFCAICGEQRLDAAHDSLAHFVQESVADVASLDSKLFRTLALLITRPGQLTLEFMAGRRVPYIRPLQLFLIANLFYFVVHPFTGYTSHLTPLRSQMDGQFYSRSANIRSVVERKVAERGEAFETYEARFNTKTEIYAKSLILLMVPMFAAVVALLHVGRRRRPLEHLVFATHYFAWDLLVVSSLFLLIYSTLILPVLAPAMGHGGFLRIFFSEMPTTMLIVPFLALAFRRVYSDNIAGAVVRALACIPLLLIIMIAYRYVLFWLTFLTV